MNRRGFLKATIAATLAVPLCAISGELSAKKPYKAPQLTQRLQPWQQRVWDDLQTHHADSSRYVLMSTRQAGKSEFRRIYESLS